VERSCRSLGKIGRFHVSQAGSAERSAFVQELCPGPAEGPPLRPAPVSAGKNGFDF